MQLPDSKGALLAWWSLLSIAVVGLDYLSGPYIQFPVLYLFPVALAAWFNGLTPAIALSLLLPTVRLWLVVGTWTVPYPLETSIVNYLIRVAVLGVVAVFVHRNAVQTRALTREVHLLKGLLPICSHCKRIRDQAQVWQLLETYIGTRTEAQFSHGICPECMRTHYGDLMGGKDQSPG